MAGILDNSSQGVRDQGGASAPTHLHHRTRPYGHIINLEAYSYWLAHPSPG